jgi:2-phosphosulfolactate phosphatase
MKTPILEVILSPGEFGPLSQRDLSQAVCVVFDILRATSSMITALGNGAEAIVPVRDIAEALDLKQQTPDALLAGERDGFRIGADLTGSIDFDLGNSPREFIAEKVRGKRIIMTTTNGTRALRSCQRAKSVLASAFLNLEATKNWLLKNAPQHLVLVCSGTHEEPALEDILAAGALCEHLWSIYRQGHVSDAAELARNIHATLGKDLPAAMKIARNGRRLLSIPDLRDDVACCIQMNTHAFCAAVDSSGAVRRLD